MSRRTCRRPSSEGLGPILIGCLVVLLGSALLLGRQTIPVQKRNARLREEKSRIAGEIRSELDTQRDLLRARHSLETDRLTLMREAYEQFGMLPPGDFVVLR